MTTSRLRIVVAGMVAGTPGHGGATWAVLQYVLGLRNLGHRVVLVEPVEDRSAQEAPPRLAGTAAATYFRDVVRRFSLEGTAALIRPGTRECFGLPRDDLVRFCGGADLLLNLSGLLRDPELLEGIRRRVYVDLDPAFTQLWHEAEGIDMGFAGHDRFVTVGLSVGRAGCPVPTCGITWLPTLPPVVLDRWPSARRARIPAFTTVANWRGYGSIQHEGVHYGQKAHALRELMALPRRSSATFAPALAIDPAELEDIRLLRQHGWVLLDPREFAGTPDAYARFVRHSLAELGVTKTGYTRSRCGWFSDRSACYLASARPVVAQETGFETHLPVGEGLLSFGTVDEAAGAVDRVLGDPERHSRAAREVAEARFDARRVLSRLLDLVGGSDPSSRGRRPGSGTAPLGPGRAGTASITLRRALERAGGPASGPVLKVTGLDRRLSPYASSLPLEEVDIQMDGGFPVRAVLKDVSDDAPTPAARAARPPFALRPGREVEVYRHLLAPRAIGPRLLAASAGGPDQRSWLLLERVDGHPLFQEGRFPVWTEVARWLAGFHREFRASPELAEPGPVDLLSYDAAFLGECMARARERVEAEAGLAPARRERFQAIWAHHHTLVRRLTEASPTLVHGDFYPSNVLVSSDSDGSREEVRIRPVDWELCGVGTGLLDLAALVAGEWPEEAREQLALAYAEEAGLTLGHDGDDPGPFLEQLSWARLHVALRWLGSPSGWRPPGEHARDWAAEALRLADRLGL